MKKRLFVSIPLPDDLQDHFAGVMEQIKIPGVKWTMHENLHITLHFIGYVEPELVPVIEDVILRAVSGAEPVSLKYLNAEIGPPSGPPRMVWGLFEDIGGVYGRLAKNLGEVLREFGNVDMKKPIPHVTLARFDKPGLASSVDLKKFDYDREREFTVPRIELMESCLSASGPTYSVLKTFSF